MALSPEQRKRVRRLVDDRWETEDEFDQFFASVTDPEELHLFAKEWNWDGGHEELRKVVRHPLCDLGTALLVYWRGSPGYYLQYASRQEAEPYERPVYGLVREIERRVKRGAFKTANFRYDPRKDLGSDMTPSRAEVKRYGRDLPAEMYLPTPRKAAEPNAAPDRGGIKRSQGSSSPRRRGR